MFSEIIFNEMFVSLDFGETSKQSRREQERGRGEIEGGRAREIEIAHRESYAKGHVRPSELVVWPAITLVPRLVSPYTGLPLPRLALFFYLSPMPISFPLYL